MPTMVTDRCLIEYMRILKAKLATVTQERDELKEKLQVSERDFLHADTARLQLIEERDALREAILGFTRKLADDVAAERSRIATTEGA